MIESPIYYWYKFRFKLKRHFVEVLKSSSSDKSVALGFALGTLIAVFPTPGFSFLIAFGLIAVFKNINKVSVFIAMAIWNAFTVIPIYWLSIEVGDSLFATDSIIYFQFEVLNQTYSYTRRFILGNLFIAIPLSIFSYYMAIFLINRVRQVKSVKLLRKEAKGKV